MVALKPYTGVVPMNVSRDAKYRVSTGGDIRLEYHISNRVKELLATSEHDELAGDVNRVKVAVAGVPGGAFYINEFGDVLVPGQDGVCYWAGHFDGTLEFKTDDGLVVTPAAPPGLEPRDPWPGPHVGIRYVLKAGGQDVRYELKSGRRTEEVYLSDEVGTAAARQTAARISAVKGPSGGRFYINEVGEMFGPTSSNDYAHFVYIGHIEDSKWFRPPDGYDRP